MVKPGAHSAAAARSTGTLPPEKKGKRSRQAAPAANDAAESVQAELAAAKETTHTPTASALVSDEEEESSRIGSPARVAQARSKNQQDASLTKKLEELEKENARLRDRLELEKVPWLSLIFVIAHL